MSETILITGFEPFGGILGNPTMDIVAALHGSRLDGRQIVGRILPVVYEGHRERLRTLMDEVDPVVAIGFGLDAEATGIQIEARAVNQADFNLPDNAGALLRNIALETNGPAQRLASFPVEDICAALSEARLKAAPSTDAGRYLCNATLFHLLELAAKRPQPPLCGFIHVPHASEQLAAETAQNPGAKRQAMPLAEMIEAARLILRETSIATRRDGAGMRTYPWQEGAVAELALR